LIDNLNQVIQDCGMKIHTKKTEMFLTKVENEA